MAVLKTFGADVLSANVEARQAYHDNRTNLSKLGVRKVADTSASAEATKTVAKRGKKAASSEVTSEVAE